MSALTLSPEILGWIEQATGRPVEKVERIPGGGTRQGWFVDVTAEPGDDLNGGALFLRYSPDGLPADSAFHPLAVEAAVISALRKAGVPVPAVYAVHPTEEAVLLERIPGDTWFYRISDPQEQVRVAQDFIGSLAFTHGLAPSHLDLPMLGPDRSVREHALARIAEIRRRATGPDGSIDPLVRLSTDWLEKNVPDYAGPVVLVQGDTGPGNFLYRDGRVTAVLDWELCHFGDPMDDLAWLSLRTVQDTFTHLPDRLAEYEQLSGHPIDVSRIWYYRVFAETTMATLTPEAADDVPGGAPEEAQRDVGNLILYVQLHRRLWLEALNQVMGLGLSRPELPDPAETPEWHGLYGDVLGMMRTLTQRVSDPLASQWAKGVARIIRYLSEVDLSGRLFAEQEAADIAGILGTAPESLASARHMLEEAVAAGTVPDEDYVRYLWNRVMRDDHLMRSASGALATRSWPPLIGK